MDDVHVAQEKKQSAWCKTWTHKRGCTHRCLLAEQAGTWWQTSITGPYPSESTKEGKNTHTQAFITYRASWHVISKDQRPISSLKNSVMVDGRAVKGRKSTGSWCHIMTWGTTTDFKRPSHCYCLSNLRFVFPFSDGCKLLCIMIQPIIHITK